MNKLVTFVSLFRNIDATTKKTSWSASFKVDGIDIGASHLPPFDKALFGPKLSKDGKTKYLASRRPVLITFGDIRKGDKRFFTNIIEIADAPQMDNSELDALLGETPAAEAPIKSEATASSVVPF